MIDYPTGTRRSLEAAVRMCVVTSMNQTAAQVTNQYIVEGNIEYVLVSAHQGARIQQPGQPYLAGHDNWQGKVYRIRGSEPGYPNLLEMTGYDIDENGSGKVVNPLGLHGYNCRHSHKPWDKSLRNPYVDENGNSKIDTKKSRDLYEKQQKQRAMERAIRKTKRQLLMKQEEIDKVAETDVKEILQNNYDRIAYKLRQQNAAYNEFCEKNGLQKQSDRLKVAGFKRAQSSKATGRARAYEHWKSSNKRITQIPASSISDKIKSGEYSTKLSIQQHNKHVEGTVKYNEYFEARTKKGGNPQSRITISEAEAQNIIDNKAGTGIIKVDRNGNPRPQEQIVCDKIIGQYYYGGEYIETNKAVIHYSKKGAHLVPIRGDNYD